MSLVLKHSKRIPNCLFIFLSLCFPRNTNDPLYFIFDSPVPTAFPARDSSCSASLASSFPACDSSCSSSLASSSKTPLASPPQAPDSQPFRNPSCVSSSAIPFPARDFLRPFSLILPSFIFVVAFNLLNAFGLTLLPVFACLLGSAPLILPNFDHSQQKNYDKDTEYPFKGIVILMQSFYYFILFHLPPKRYVRHF